MPAEIYIHDGWIGDTAAISVADSDNIVLGVLVPGHQPPGGTWSAACPGKVHVDVYLQPPCAIGDKGNNRLFHDQTILYGFDPFDAMCNLNCFIDEVLGTNKTAQLDDALVRFYTDLE